MNFCCCTDYCINKKGKSNQLYLPDENNQRQKNNNDNNNDKSDEFQYRNQGKNKINVDYEKNSNKTSETPSNEDHFFNGTIGLVNLGLCCYFNSAIQNLKNIFPLTLYVLKNYQKFNKSGFAYDYCKLIANLINQNKHQYCEPSKFFYHLQKLAPNFQIGEQNDSNICIMYILNNLEKELKKSGDPSPEIVDLFDMKERENFKCYIYKSFGKRNSVILDYFYGFQQDIYKCMNKKCNYIKCSYQGFNVLNIPIVRQTNDRILSLEKAIEYYEFGRLHSEKEEGFDCSNCKGKKILTQSIIISYPKILIINFKRIGENYFYNHPVDVPLELNFGKVKYKYELIGFIKHIGNDKSGHNIAVCKNFFDNRWYEYDDHIVTPLEKSIKKVNGIINNKMPDTKNAFLFFYKKFGIFENIETEQDKKIIIDQSNDLRKLFK